jgi:hypothetical protein
MPEVSQAVTRDEIQASRLEQLWLDAICKRFGQPDCLPAEVTTDRSERDTNVTTVWSKGRVVAVAVRQRDVANYTVVTLVQIQDAG